MSKPEDIKLNQDDLIVPIYIDTNILLDLLASIEGGFSIVEKITTRNAQNKEADQSTNISAGTEFGIPNILNLIKINLGGSLNWKQGKEAAEEHSSERYHTYGSLLQRFRKALLDQGIIKVVDESKESWDKIAPHDFVEVRGKFQPNPLTHSITNIEGLLGLLELFSQFNNPSSSNKTNKSRQNTALQANSSNTFNQISSAQVQQIRKLIKGLIEQLEQKDIRTTVVDLHGSNHYKAVASLFTENLRDSSMTELLHKEYKLLGKVVGKLTDPASYIDLLQGTAFSGFDEKLITSLIDSLNQPNSSIHLPTAETKITAPLIQVVPIAIYV